MSAFKTALLVSFCVVDFGLGVWLALAFLSAATTSGAAGLLNLNNAGYLLLTAFLLGVPILCWHLRARASLSARLLLAAAPIAVFLALGGKLWVWVRWA